MEWKEIPGYEGIYEISEHGDIRRLQNSDGYTAGTRLKPYRYPNGYFRIALRKERHVKTYGVHRLVLLAFVGDEPRLDVNHRDGVKTNNHVSNLEYCTRQANAIHARAVLGRERGEQHGRAKLRDRDIPVIRQAVQDGNAMSWLATVFEVGGSTISAIHCGRSWRHVPTA